MTVVTERWIDAAETVIVAGDPDRVVNSYAGASPRFFGELYSRVETELPVVRLDRSWRCPDEHFAAAVRVLRAEREAPALTTDGPGEILRHRTGQYEHDGNQWYFPDPGTDGSAYRLWETYGPGIMFLTRTQKQADGIAAALDDEGVIYRSQSSVGGSWETRLSLLRALDLLEDVTPDRTARTSIDDYSGDTRHQSPEKRALDVADAETLLAHTHGRYLESDRDERREWLWEYERGGDKPVPLAEFDEHVTPKWWLRYNGGASSIDHFTRLDDRD